MGNCLVTTLKQSVDDNSLQKLGEAVFEVVKSIGIRVNAAASIRVLSGSITWNGNTYVPGDSFTTDGSSALRVSGTIGSKFAIKNKYNGLPPILADGAISFVNLFDLSYVESMSSGFKNDFDVKAIMNVNKKATNKELIFGLNGTTAIDELSEVANCNFATWGSASPLWKGASTWASTTLRDTRKYALLANGKFASGTDLDNYFINMAACVNQKTPNGYNTYTFTTEDGTNRTSASDDAVSKIVGKLGTSGWIKINGVTQ